MLFQHGVDLRQNLVLLIGNGPSAWWVTAEKVRRIRERFSPDLVVFACNRTAPKVGADVACAVDRAMVEEFLATGVFHNQAMLVGFEVFRAIAAESKFSVMPLDGSNLYFFQNDLQGTGTGSAVFQTVARMHADVIYLVGFDGPQDPRTRWAGTDHYRSTPTHPGLLEEWNRQIVAAAKTALLEGTVGAIGAAPTPGGSLLGAIGAEKRSVPRAGRSRAARFLVAMNELCERHACQPSA